MPGEECDISCSNEEAVGMESGGREGRWEPGWRREGGSGEECWDGEPGGASL